MTAFDRRAASAVALATHASRGPGSEGFPVRPAARSIETSNQLVVEPGSPGPTVWF